jgi:hypothetical protein
VRRGKALSHTVRAAWDRHSGPTSLRLVVEADLPRGQARPSRLQYQRLDSWIVDCRTTEAADYAPAAIRELMRQLDGKVVAEHTQEQDRPESLT